jgi:hypothetical protein
MRNLFILFIGMLILGFEQIPLATGRNMPTPNCPVQIDKITIRFSKTEPWDFKYPAAPGTLEVRYTNISGKDIEGGVAMVKSPFFVGDPLPAVRDQGELAISLLRTRAGEKQTARLNVFARTIPNKGWVKQITFADGTKWATSDPNACSYPIHR